MQTKCKLNNVVLFLNLFYFQSKEIGKSFKFQIYYFTLFTEKLISIVYTNAEIKKNTNRN